jgi:hypothetical protein
MNKKLTVFDSDGIVRDKASLKGTDIILKELDNGKVLFRGSNKVIVSGSELNAIKDFDFDDFTCSSDNDFLTKIPSYDMAFAAAQHPMRYKDGVNTPIGVQAIAGSDLTYYSGASGSVLSGVISALSTSDQDHQKFYQGFTRRVCLWAVGIDGCGVEASRVFKVQNTKWIMPYGYIGQNPIYPNAETYLIPFKYRTPDADLQGAYRGQYFGRTEIGNSAVGYYFKAFDELPVLIRRYADDSSDLANVDDVWKDTSVSEAEVVVQLKMSISATDCREYFQKLVSVYDAKINTISLCSAVPYANPDSGQVEYLDIRPFTKFNFPNEALVDTSKGIDITYYLYY